MLTNQLHISYAALGREFKNSFEDLIKNLNAQQAENARLNQQILEANAALVASNKAAQGRITEVVDDERQKSAAERQQLFSQITSLITATAEAQEKRLSEQMAGVSGEMGAANATHNTQQSVYNEGMSAWSSKSQEIVAGAARSRDGVKAKIKADFAMATQHSTSIKDTTTSVHDSTVKTVEAQMAHMDTQLHSLDDIVSRIRAQNDVHHAAHTSSLSALTSTVQSSYSSIGDHLSTSFTRVQSLEADMSAQATALKETLPALSEGADIRAPLQELRDEIAHQQLMEYKPTGETPQRNAYNVPSTLPRTESHETLLSRLRDRPASSERTRSPSKALIFNDATNNTTSISDDLTLPTLDKDKPIFPRSQSAFAGLGTSMMTGPSLRELDVNIVSQETSLPLVSPSEIDVGAVPPHKKQNRGDGADNSKLPMKKMGRKTVAGVAASHGPSDRENLSITSFAASVGPGLAGGKRRLRSQGSQ